MKQFNLQLFAEEAEAAAEISPTAEDTAGADTGTEQAAPAQTLDEIIKSNPEYQKQYEDGIKERIAKRFKNQKDNQAVIDRLNPFVAMTAKKYGIQAGENGEYDLDAITKAMQNDTSMYEEEAFKRGMNVEDYMHMRNVEIENEQLRRASQQAAQDAESREQFNRLVQEAEQLKATIYPEFDLEAELSNPQFGTLIANGFPLQNAYEAVHVQDILAGGMKYAIEKTKENVSKSIQAGATRPRENGLSAQSASNPGRIDISKLTPTEMADYIARAKAGEKITFR